VLYATVSNGTGYAKVKISQTKTCTTLENCIAALNALKDAYEAHRADTTFHLVANTTDAVTSDDAEDFATAVTLADELKTDYNNHRTDTNENSHLFDDDVNSVTATSTPTTLAGLISLVEDIIDQYVAHIQDETYGYHSACPDDTNMPAATAPRINYVYLRWRAPTGESNDAYA